MKFAYGVIVNMAEGVKTSVDRFEILVQELSVERLYSYHLNHGLVVGG